MSAIELKESESYITLLPFYYSGYIFLAPNLLTRVFTKIPLYGQCNDDNYMIHQVRTLPQYIQLTDYCLLFINHHPSRCVHMSCNNIESVHL